jgi:ribose transport system substrate-binding protein
MESFISKRMMAIGLATVLLSLIVAASAGAGGSADPAAAGSRQKVNTILTQLKAQVGKGGAIASQWPALKASPCANPKPIPAGKIIVGYAYASKKNPWQVQNAIGGEWYLQNHPDVAKVYSTDSEENPSKQISDIQSLIAKGINVLVTNPVTTAVSPAVLQACNRGITVVVYDRFVTPATPFTASMYANEVQDGYNGGQAIVKALKGNGNVVIIPGIAGAGVTEDRVKGAKLAMAKAPGVKVLGLAYSDWDPAKGRKIMEQFLTKYPKIDAVWSDSGVQAVGILQALQEAKRLDQVKIVVGGQLNGYLKQWQKLGIVGYGSTISTDVGILSAQLALDIAEGKYKPRSNVPAPLVVIDQSTLKKYLRNDLPDGYWATQVLPNSALQKIFGK